MSSPPSFNQRPLASAAQVAQSDATSMEVTKPSHPSVLVNPEPAREDQVPNAGVDATKPNPPSVFMNSEPMREDQVQNAVKFLSHPKVRGSPVIYRRSFLEKKGLTKEEIDEAFCRVPDPPPTAQATNINQEGQVRSTTNIQQPGTIQAVQPAASTPSGVISAGGTLTSTRFLWYHAVIAVGVLAVSGAGTAVLIKKTIVPRLKSWIRKVVREDEDLVKKIDSKPTVVEEAASAAKAAAAAATDVAKASQELVNSRNEEKKYFGEFMHLLDMQIQELKSVSNAVRKLEEQNNYQPRTYVADQEDIKVSTAHPKITYANGKSEYDTHSVRSTSPPVSAEPSAAPHSKSYMEIMAMVQRGEKPPNIREINDQPPNPNQPISNPRLAPRIKPWEASQVENNSSHVLQTQLSYGASNSRVEANSGTYQREGESNVPWWQQKNARITEIENGDGLLSGQTIERPIQRAWVPPQPPPVVMPEAAEAIRRPKPPATKETMATADQSPPRSADVTDELQRITKISELGSAIDHNVAGSGSNSIEIQEEQNGSYE